MLFPNMMTVTSKPNLSPKGNSQTIILQVKGRKGYVESRFLHPAQADHVPAVYTKKEFSAQTVKKWQLTVLGLSQGIFAEPRTFMENLYDSGLEVKTVEMPWG